MSGESGALFLWVFLPGVGIGYVLHAAVTAFRQITSEQHQIDELAQARRVRTHHRAPGGAA